MPDVFDHISKDVFQRSKRDAIVDGVLTSIEKNTLERGDPLPSVNKFIQKLGVARMTVVKALNILKERGVIFSEDKVGYFVRDVNVKREMKVFLFLTGFDSYHEALYNSIIENVRNENVVIDLYFHHCNPKLFKSVLQENLGSYGCYVVTPFHHPQMRDWLSKIPKNKLVQIIRNSVLEEVSSVSQDFCFGLKKSLLDLINPLKKYQKFTLVFPDKKGHPEEIKIAFQEFCDENQLDYSIINKVSKNQITEQAAYWVIEDDDLLSLIKNGEELGYEVGKELGILSYNETPMKEIIRSGITVVSVDFKKMGESIAASILNPSIRNDVFVPKIIFRNSL